MGFVKSIPIRNSLALTKYQHVLREFCETNWIKKQPENRGVFNVLMIQFGSNTTGKSKRCFAYPVEITKTKRAGAGLVKSIPIRNSLALTSNQNV